MWNGWRRLRGAAFALGLTALAGAGAMAGLAALDRAFPPPLDAAGDVSAEIVDRDGRLLRAFAAGQGQWRLAVSLDEVDESFLRMLVAYEDRRFHDHAGVDPLAMLRAAGQLLANGRIVSGASTLTMQLARLSEPRDARTFGAKLRQIARAIQIERRLSKREILERYLTLAPYGGNLEGVRAASLAWFGKEPRRLSLDEAALLVALPQSPEARRPDRHPDAAAAARDRVLGRMAGAGLVEPVQIARAAVRPVPRARRELPSLAAHAAHAARRAHPDGMRVALTLSAPVQAGLEAVAREAAARLGDGLSVAMVLADARNGDILAEIGSPDHLDPDRAGAIDMTRAIRSPGSALKPFIYGLAFEEGLVAQETLIDDRPADFGGYRPRNFDMAYQGEVSVRQALQLSLNVPAVRLLEGVGVARLAARLRLAGAPLSLPRGEMPGLAIALGGAGLSLRDLVQLYTAFPAGGRVAKLSNAPGREASAHPLLEPAAAWQIADILGGVVSPEGRPDLGIAYKTGTSYGYRDAWAVGFDGRHVLGVWVGRPDGGWTPGLSGYRTAAPILFDAFARSGLPRAPRRPAPPGAMRLPHGDLPVTQRRFAEPGRLAARATPEPAPQIVFPPDGARIELGLSEGAGQALALKLQGGRAPFRWLANGRPLPERARRRDISWRPDGAGFSTLTVIDSAGRAASVRVFIE